MDLWEDVKLQFPALHDDRVVYLDSAATTQMPEVVLKAVSDYERAGRGNPHRGLHDFAARATELLQASRAAVAQFIGAQPAELLFTKGTTEGLNLVTQALGSQLGPGDEVVLTIFEHHAMLLPWRQLALERGFTIKYLPMSEVGTVDLELAKRIITSKTRVVAVIHASNVLGTILPVAEIVELAHSVGAWVILDAAQSVARLPIDVRTLGCDAMAFGAHKMYGPEGIGALYIADRLRPHLKPLLFGGGMVDEVLDDTIRYAEDVRLFEAGSPNVGGAAGFAAACTFLKSLGLERVRERELALISRLVSGLDQLPRVKLHSAEPALGRVGVVSFSIEGVHSHDAAQILADQGIAVRAGYHCAAPLTRCLDLSGTVRVSFGVYSLATDVDRLVTGIRNVLDRFPL
ncbi:MAG: cysteine desulfurase [Patescibacteria group bacterium]